MVTMDRSGMPVISDVDTNNHKFHMDTNVGDGEGSLFTNISIYYSASIVNLSYSSNNWNKLNTCDVDWATASSYATSKYWTLRLGKTLHSQTAPDESTK